MVEPGERVRSPVELVKYLPGEDCEKCGFDSCFEFALSLIERTVRPEKCPVLTEKGLKKIKDLLAPPMYEITFGVGEKAVTIGGEEAMHREDLAFFGKTVIAIDVWDTLSDVRLEGRIEEIKNLKIERFKEVFEVDAISLRSVSGDPKTFRKLVSKVSEATDLPLILCSFDPKVLEAGVRVVKDKKPLLYAATKDNWSEVLRIAKKYNTAVAIFSPNDLDTLGSIAKTFSKEGINDLVLDPGTFCEPGSIVQTFSNLTMLRRACVEDKVKEVSYPTMAVPAIFTLSFSNKIKGVQYETFLANALITRGINLLIVSSTHVWAFMPMVYLREGIFKHPKLEAVVDPGLYEFSEPDRMSPLMVTSNYSLTYGIVSGDIERGKIPCYLLVVDTGGLSVDTAVGSGDFSGDAIAEAVEEYNIEEKIDHRVIIIPQVAAEIKEEVEEALPDWKVIVGPKDSTEIPHFLKDRWKEFLD
ncbi:MAG: acetyl-CoA decarbonylase/synthase complex subunit gamma [Candidatus Syntropharchaeia archaeon]